ncbi:putative biotin transporter BioY [Chlamydiales bacterium STE3]|nr:putative biotin transporter BioY [Chlamydiales bacterium STE3]
MSLSQEITLKTSQTESLLKEALFIFAASLFIALCSQISVPLFFTPVPMTLQTFAIAMTGWALGSKRGALAVLMYLLEGAMGLPVFSHLHSGIGSLIGPTGGYMFGFIFGAIISGSITHRSTSFPRLALGFFLCSAAIHLCGLPWLSLWVGAERTLQLGLLPFILGDLVKIGLSISSAKLWHPKKQLNFPGPV